MWPKPGAVMAGACAVVEMPLVEISERSESAPNGPSGISAEVPEGGGGGGAGLAAAWRGADGAGGGPFLATDGGERPVEVAKTDGGSSMRL